jgi:uncharacterized protein YbjT (DUF2867 family)
LVHSQTIAPTLAFRTVNKVYPFRVYRHFTTMSSEKKLLTIFGGTGNQGGSIISVILANPSLNSQFSLRAITRDTTSPKAQALAAKGVELAKADLTDAATIKEAVKGSYGVFGVTDYWITMDKNDEMSQGKNIVDASVAAGVKHLVWSTLPNVTKLTDGVLSKVEHFDSKAAVADYAKENKGDMIVSNFMPGYFMSNLTTTIKKGDDGVAALSLPWEAEKTWIPLADIRNDVGKYVAGLFERGREADGASVQAVSEWAHPKDIVEMVSKVSGKEVKFVETEMSVEIASKLDRIPEEMMQNMLLIRDYSYYGKGAETRQDESDKWLATGTSKTSWEDFAKKNKWNV